MVLLKLVCRFIINRLLFEVLFLFSQVGSSSVSQIFFLKMVNQSPYKVVQSSNFVTFLARDDVCTHGSCADNRFSFFFIAPLSLHGRISKRIDFLNSREMRVEHRDTFQLGRWKPSRIDVLKFYCVMLKQLDGCWQRPSFVFLLAASVLLFVTVFYGQSLTT